MDPPPLPLSPPLGALPSGEAIHPLPAAAISGSGSGGGDGGPPPLSLPPSLIVIAGLIALVFLASISIHVLLRLLSRPPSSSTRGVHRHSLSSISDAAGGGTDSSKALSDREKAALIDNLPLFTMASSLAALPKSSPDCAVCLTSFHPDAELRLLPACRHAFHSECIDTWLRSTPSCPLCRAPITLPHPPLIPDSAAATAPRSSSFRIEIGSISNRMTSSAASDEEYPPTMPPLPSHLHSYSLGSFDYVVEEEVEVEAVIARLTRARAECPKEEAAPRAPGEEMAEAVGEGEEERGWLREYVDRLASSASSSFNSLRFSGRWSARWSNRLEEDGGGGEGRDSWPWDPEGNQAPPPHRDAEEAGFYALYSHSSKRERVRGPDNRSGRRSGRQLHAAM